ncbi:beta-lactamase domain protein [Burkholderia sp. H160]|nr:beta-lactamase domain protein [Burkholderia sp. H160]
MPAAQCHLAGGRPIQALYFLEIALEASPSNRSALETQLQVLECLADANGGLIFDELGWLENAIAETKAELKSAVA